MPTTIRPIKYSLPWHVTIFPHSLISTMISIVHSTLPFKYIMSKVSLINCLFRWILSISLLKTLYKTSFIRLSFRKILISTSMRFIICPLSFIFIAVQDVPKNPSPIRLILLDLSFIYTTIFINKSSLSFSYSIHKSSLIVRTIFIEKLTFSMTFSFNPLSTVVSRRLFCFYIRLRSKTLRYNFEF